MRDIFVMELVAKTMTWMTIDVDRHQTCMEKIRFISSSTFHLSCQFLHVVIILIIWEVFLMAVVSHFMTTAFYRINIQKFCSQIEIWLFPTQIKKKAAIERTNQRQISAQYSVDE